MAVAGAGRTEILGLYRSLLRAAREFSDYNIREYAKRRTVDGFRQNQQLRDTNSILEVYQEGKKQLEMVRRQSMVYSLYAPKVKSIMDLQTPIPNSVR